MSLHMARDPLRPSTSRVPLPKHTIGWYRTKLSPEVSAAIHEVSDVKGAIQTLSFLGMLATFFLLTLYFRVRGSIWGCTVSVLLYGMQANFCINDMHELGHGHVFKTKWLNGFFMRIISFLGWEAPQKIENFLNTICIDFVGV